VAQKDAFRLADVLPRDRWLIVDSLLQHGVGRGKGESGPRQVAFMILGRGD
jgi:hypothetical protein